MDEGPIPFDKVLPQGHSNREDLRGNCGNHLGYEDREAIVDPKLCPPLRLRFGMCVGRAWYAGEEH